MKKKEIKKKLFTFFLLLCFFGLTILSASGAQEQKGPVEITVFRPGQPDKVKSFMEPALKEFMAANPGIKVEPIYMGWNEWIQKYKTLFASDQQPDVIMFWDTNLSESAVQGKLLAMDDYLDWDMLKGYPESLMKKGKVDGKQMLIPASANAYFLLWNKEIFANAGLNPERPPQNWDELIAYSKAIKKNVNAKDIYPLGLPAMRNEKIFDILTILYYAGTGNLWFDKDNKPLFNTPEGLNAIEYWLSLKEYDLPGSTQISTGDLRAGFRDGKIGMIVDGAWIFPMLQAKYGENLDDSIFGIAPMPAGPAGQITEGGFDGWVIANDNAPEAAGKLISFLASPQQQYMHDTKYGGTPIYQYELGKYPFNFDFWKMTIKARDEFECWQRAGVYHPAPKAIYTIGAGIFQKVWINELTPKEGLNEFEKQMTALTAKY